MTDPFSIALVVGSPSARSRTAALAQHVADRLSRHAFRVRIIKVRDLPAQALIHADASAPEVASALRTIEQADGVIVASPVYKAAYSGVLKSFLDLLPQRGLQGKVVLPLLTGGTLAHVLALDYGLRPVLQSLEPRQVVSGLFLLDQWITLTEDDGAELNPEVGPRLETIVQGFVDGVRSVYEYR
ncbi:MAG: NADPH-dependent FMN reductase [Myxococcales bacterium]